MIFKSSQLSDYENCLHGPRTQGDMGPCSWRKRLHWTHDHALVQTPASRSYSALTG